MPGLLIDNKEVQVTGLTVLNRNDTEKLPLSREDGRPRRTRWVRMQINHTTKGRHPQSIRPGPATDAGREFRVAEYWATSPKSSAAHGIIDTDGSVGIIADLFRWTTYHAGNINVNERSVGWEMYQHGDGSINAETIEAQVKVNIATCIAMGIQMQVHLPYKRRPLKRLYTGGADMVGVFGHRDVTSNRGAGDPGDLIMEALVGAGFERFDFEAGEDKEAWRERQEMLGVFPDGIPGPQTTAALREAGYKHGLWALGKAEDGPQPDLVGLICRALGCS